MHLYPIDWIILFIFSGIALARILPRFFTASTVTARIQSTPELNSSRSI